MKKIVSIVLALVMVLSLTACSGSASSTTAAGNDKETQAAAGTNETAEPVEIVAIAKSIATSSWQLFGTGCKAAAAELGDKVEFTFDGASSSTALEESLNLIENYLANGCDAIVVATDASGAGALLTNAQKDGVSVIIADNTLNGYDGQDNLTTYDNKMSGKLAADAMLDALKANNYDYNGKKIVVISPAPGVSVLEDRDEAFREEMAAIAPEIEILETMYCDGDNAVALSNAQDSWQTYGEEIVGMYGLDEGVCDAISRCKDENGLQGKFEIIGIDATDLVIADIEKGNVAAVIGMSMYQEGYNCVMNAYKAATGEALEPITALDPMIVTIDNYMTDDARRIWDSTVLEK